MMEMYLDIKNNRKVAIVRESPSKTVIVKDLKTGRRYLADKVNLKEIPSK